MNFNMLMLVSPSRYVASAVSLSMIFLLGLVIVQSFHEINEYADSMIILHPSRKRDGTGPLSVCLSADLGIGLFIYLFSIQAVRSLIHKSLSKFEAVYGGYSCHLAGNTPSLDPRIYEVGFFFGLPSDHGF